MGAESSDRRLVPPNGPRPFFFPPGVRRVFAPHSPKSFSFYLMFQAPPKFVRMRGLFLYLSSGPLRSLLTLPDVGFLPGCFFQAAPGSCPKDHLIDKGWPNPSNWISNKRVGTLLSARSACHEGVLRPFFERLVFFF